MAGEGERMRPPCGVQGEKTLPASNIIERFGRRAACMGRKQHRKREACFLRRDTRVRFVRGRGMHGGQGVTHVRQTARKERRCRQQATHGEIRPSCGAHGKKTALKAGSLFFFEPRYRMHLHGKGECMASEGDACPPDGAQGEEGGRQQTTRGEIRSPCGEQGKEMSPASNTMAISVRHVACKGRKWR